MSEERSWEALFVEAYIVKSKRARYLSQLKNSKRRQKLLDRLNHALDHDEKYATELPPECQTDEALLRLLRQKNVRPTCYLIADANENDGQELRLEDAVSQLFGSQFGALIICPPKPIAIYKGEDIGRLVLLEK